jgi:hypothetical protein
MAEGTKKQSKGELAAWRKLERELSATYSSLDKSVRQASKAVMVSERLTLRIPADAKDRARAARRIHEFSRELSKVLRDNLGKVNRERMTAAMGKRMR